MLSTTNIYIGGAIIVGLLFIIKKKLINSSMSEFTIFFAGASIYLFLKYIGVGSECNNKRVNRTVDTVEHIYGKY